MFAENKTFYFFAVGFFIHFAFVFQHSNVGHKGEKQCQLTKPVCISLNYQELCSVKNQFHI